MRVGYIGLGALGGALARRFLPDHSLTVWDMNPAAMAALEQAGASAARSAGDLGRRSDVVLLCLPRSSDVRQLVFGKDGLAEGLSAGKLVIDQTSGVPSETRDIAANLSERGVAMMDACVSASPPLVAQGGATLMASAPDDIYARALPILRVISEKIYRCGSHVGDGQAMKTVSNAMNGACRWGTLELVSVGSKTGVPLRYMADRLNEGEAANQTTERMLPAIAEGRTSTDFALTLMLKDVNQAVLLGMQLGVPMPITNVLRDLLQFGVNTLGVGARLEAVVGLVESMAATRFAQPSDAETPVVSAKARSAEHDAWIVGVIGEAIASLCTLVTYECAAAGLKYGLALTDMAVVLPRSSGWSAPLRRILPRLASGGPGDGQSLRVVAEQLNRAAGAAIEAGVPTPMFSAVRGIIDAAANQLGEDANMDALSRLYEDAAAISFAGAGSDPKQGD